MNGVFSELLSDKTKQTTWYSDFAYSVISESPWFVLGGQNRIGSGAGAFVSHYYYGAANSYDGFRVVLS